MRLAWKTTSENEIGHLKETLDAQSIAYTIEVEQEKAWESEEYGSTVYSLWINNDDDFEKAKTLLQSADLPSAQPSVSWNNGPSSPLQEFVQQKFRLSIQEKPARSTAFWTLCIFFISLGLFIADAYQHTNQQLSPLRQTLLFDDPPSNWEGVYTQLANRGEKTTLSFELFAKKIREGELWRCITPVLLHGDLLHLIFNMLWLIFLGSQLEERLSKFRLFSLFCILAALSNTAQYVMTGPLFIGFSGVACGMVGFIHARQKQAPWEAYVLTPATYSFVFFFIFALAALSVITFVFEYFWGFTIAIGFANTAHISGLLAGLLLGKCPWFSAHTTHLLGETVQQ